MSQQHTLLSVTGHASASPALIIPSYSPPLIFSYPTIFSHIYDLSSNLFSLIPLPSQSPISIILPNGLEFIASFFAVTFSRHIAAPLNPAYTENEFKFYLEDSKSKFIIVPKGWCKEDKPAVKAARGLGIDVVEIWWNEADGKFGFTIDRKEEKQGQKINARAVSSKLEESDVALLLHTSGTTGRPKAVPLTHRNLTRTMQNITRTYNLTPSDRTLLVMPLFHVHGLMGGLLSTLLSGGAVVVPPRFSATTFWNDFTRFGCTWYTAVPTIHQILLRHPVPSPPPKIRFIRSCSSSLAPSVLHSLESTFQAPVLEAYAMTEAAHQMTSNPLPPAIHKPGSVGIGQGVEIVILDEKGNEVQEGEVCVIGENITRGYLNNPKANAEAFTKAGYFRTGDQGYLDSDGYLHLTGRIKEFINRGGEKISPLEIDAALLSHPDIVEAVSFAVPDEIYGQEVWAAVVVNNGKGQVSEDDVKNFVKTKISAYKVPKKVVFTDVMPKTATGKVQRRLVRDKFFTKDKAKL
ncbi:4430_t:CDS:2 [Paraglomus brasilianum]|uniref:4430_t:CDS:1 n=1 Tax=Paraglomus brasilianum TaxID=144538 RepID=A0A9N9BQ30_9GLOM|nr:4430_t:CDS:2 [Paraglomus brasilianum]